MCSFTSAVVFLFDYTGETMYKKKYPFNKVKRFIHTVVKNLKLIKVDKSFVQLHMDVNIIINSKEQ